MKTIEDAYADPSNEGNRKIILRQHKPGDIGWMIFRSAMVYAEEYKCDERCEALLAQI